MPIHEHGYRQWNGQLGSRASRWLSITHSGILTAMRVRWTRFLLILAFAPTLYFTVIFFALGNATAEDGSGVRGIGGGLLRGFLDSHELQAKLSTDPSSLRAPLWNDIFLTLQGSAQLLLACMVAIVVAPSLIARDVKSKSFLIYFSKPITRVDYILGKASVLIAFLSVTILAPTVLIYIVGLATSPDSSTFSQTIEVVPRIFAGAVLQIVPITVLALMISAFNSEERIARFITLCVLAVGDIAFQVFDATTDATWPMLLSFRNAIQVAISAVYDEPIIQHLSLSGDSALAFLWLGSWTILGLVVIWRRISAPMSV